jgi:F0F1-type ATP synthase alpha subunit
MDIRAAEISAILKEQIKNFGQEAEVSEIGQVLSVGDGIARPARWSSLPTARAAWR